jgi:hypothetical protein
VRLFAAPPRIFLNSNLRTTFLVRGRAVTPLVSTIATNAHSIGLHLVNGNGSLEMELGLV